MILKRVIKIFWRAWFICLICFLAFSVATFFNNKPSVKNSTSDYLLAWPGILPDSKPYKLKVLRNKIIEKIIIGRVQKVEFDLLMADKTIYASKLLFDKGQVVLAKETVLKGENYFSMLVQDYNNALLKHEKIPSLLDRNIDQAVSKHQEVFSEMEKRAQDKDKETFQITYKFSQINYQFIIGLRNTKK